MIVCILTPSFSVGAETITLSPQETDTRWGFKMNIGLALLDTPNTPNYVEAYYMHSYADTSDQTYFENSYNTYYDTTYTTAKRLSTATTFYNCHSYAWHSQNVSTNHYWIDYPYPYYSDGSYYEVTTPIPGDIICYFDDNGTANDSSDDNNLHSGIVILSIAGATSNGLCGISNTLIVESKWGPAGLYRHNGYECPYTDYVLNINSSTGESYRAEYVKFYRKANHSHNHNTYSELDSDYHKCICSCGQIIHAPHVWLSTPIYTSYATLSEISPTYIPQYTCKDCGMITLNP